MSLVVYQQPTAVTDIIFADPPIINPYRRFFDFAAAYQTVLDHVAALPSDRTPEQHTRRAYTYGLDHFLAFVGNHDLPTRDVMRAYLAALVNRGLSSSTIVSKYLTPARHFCRALSDQPLRFEDAGDARMFFGLLEWRDQIRQAAEISNPKPESHSDVSGLYDPRFHRLALTQVNAVLRQMDTQTLTGLRDYALLHVAFSSALRISEIQRITLNSISYQDSSSVIRVRGKRSNMTPVPVAEKAVADLVRYVTAYNAGLPDGDPRYITPDTPVWQPLTRGDTYLPLKLYSPIDGITRQSLHGIIKRRVATICPGFSPHDTRRTAAALAFEAGMPLPMIQKLLRHKDAATTLRYIGQKPDYAGSNLSTYNVNFG